jgi:hypothetical protein
VIGVSGPAGNKLAAQPGRIASIGTQSWTAIRLYPQILFCRRSGRFSCAGATKRIRFRSGRFLSKNLAGVAIPANADSPSDITIHCVEEIDEKASPIGAKGIGEVDATSVAAAVANAVIHAIGNAHS